MLLLFSSLFLLLSQQTSFGVCFVTDDADENEDNDVTESLPSPCSIPSLPFCCCCCLAICRRFELQLLLQVVTSSQTLSHFFLQVKGLLQTTQILVGRFSLATVFPFLFFMANKRVVVVE